MRNFGFDENVQIVDKGINAKMNEFQAAMGLLNLEIVDQEIEKRRRLCEIYKRELRGIVEFQRLSEDITKYNYIYMPVVFPSEEIRDAVHEELKKQGYNTRKYFFPSLDTVFDKDNRREVARDISQRILHLPLYGDLEEEHIETICSVMRACVRG